MIERFVKTKRHLETARGRTMLVGRALVVSLVLALLLIPTTCAQVMGPHSIFTDPTAGHIHHHSGSGDGDGDVQTIADLEWHVISSNGSPGWLLAETEQDDDDCPVMPGLRDLPSTMAMGAINAPATLGDDLRLELPAADRPVEAGDMSLRAAFLQIEPPPPR